MGLLLEPDGELFKVVRRIHVQCVSIQKISGKEVYYTNFSILIVKIML